MWLGDVRAEYVCSRPFSSGGALVAQRSSVSTPQLIEPDGRICRVAQPLLAFAPTDPTMRALPQYLHDCSGCFQLERSPGGACTHWKAPPSHGAQVDRTFVIASDWGSAWDPNAASNSRFREQSDLLTIGRSRRSRAGPPATDELRSNLSKSSLQLVSR